MQMQSFVFKGGFKASTCKDDKHGFVHTESCIGTNTAAPAGSCVFEKGWCMIQPNQRFIFIWCVFSKTGKKRVSMNIASKKPSSFNNYSTKGTLHCYKHFCTLSSTVQLFERNPALLQGLLLRLCGIYIFRLRRVPVEKQHGMFFQT